MLIRAPDVRPHQPMAVPVGDPPPDFLLVPLPFALTAEVSGAGAALLPFGAEAASRIREIRNKGNQIMTIIKLTAEVISLSLFLAGVAAICIAVAS
ncbi:putative transport protein [Roseibium sp. TrichSKD4]|nr:putative transport protein [Roseibium sp. TrichSKD4]